MKLGFQVVVEAPGAHGETWIQIRLPGSDATLSLSGFNGIICETADIKGEIQTLQVNGIETEFCELHVLFS